MPLPRRQVLVVTFFLVAGTVVWRQGDLFTGGVDPVVVAKAMLSLLALALSWRMAARSAAPRPRGTGSLWILLLLLAVTIFGALTNGTLAASAVVAVRVIVLAVTLHLLLRSQPALAVVSGLVWSGGAIALVAAVTGLPTLSRGRLDGGLPPLNPNGMALLAGVVVLAVLWQIVLGKTRWYLWLIAIGFLGIAWLTGSRTAMIMLLPAALLMIVQIRRPSSALVGGLLATVAVVVPAAIWTGAITSFLGRNGTGTSTLDSRYIAWSAAFSWAGDSWQRYFGGGLSVKMIPVTGQWWQTQLLDSSWVSALVQGGLIGLLLAALWVLWVLRGALLTPRPYRILFLGLLVFVVGRSFLESGLFDATPEFLLFFVTSVMVEGGSRPALRALPPVRATRESARAEVTPGVAASSGGVVESRGPAFPQPVDPGRTL